MFPCSILPWRCISIDLYLSSYMFISTLSHIKPEYSFLVLSEFQVSKIHLLITLCLSVCTILIKFDIGMFHCNSFGYNQKVT